MNLFVKNLEDNVNLKQKQAIEGITGNFYWYLHRLETMICWVNKFCIFIKSGISANKERIIWFWYKFPIIMNIYPSKCCFLWLITGIGDNILITLQEKYFAMRKSNSPLYIPIYLFPMNDIPGNHIKSLWV